jgi:hypothetical protein
MDSQGLDPSEFEPGGRYFALTAALTAIRMMALLMFAYFIGSALAVSMSWERNHSILMATIHGIVGWVYVIYVAIQ